MSAFFVAGCNCTEVLQTVDGALDDIASLIGLRIEPGWRAAFPSTAQAVGFGISSFGANAANTATCKNAARLAGAIGTVDAKAGRSFPRAAAPQARNANCIEYDVKLGDVGALSRCHDERQRSGMTINAEVNLTGVAAARMAKPLVSYSPLFSA